MNEPQTISPRRRLQELLAIPERERTDAQWDEINDLEITLASVNRDSAPEQSQVARQRTPQTDRRPKPAGGANSGGGAQPRKPASKFQKRPPKPKAPQA